LKQRAITRRPTEKRDGHKKTKEEGKKKEKGR